ncbi:Sodium-dependent glucose transporter 1 [Galdieria sulphuraria]|nr:Sodium-dependent glucose transporter 1 [Galdieria sulphuraria]
MSISNVGSGSLWTHFKQPERWSRDGIYRLSGCCFMSFFGLGLVIGLLGPALPPLAEALSLKQAESLGFLFTVRGVGYFLGSLLFGFIGKKLSYRSLIAGFVDTGGNAAVGSLLAEDPLADTFMKHCLGLLSRWFALPLHWTQFLGIDNNEEERWMDASVENNTTVQATPSTPPPQSNRKLLLVLVAFAAFFYVGCEIGFGGWIATYSLNSHSEDLFRFLYHFIYLVAPFSS